MTTATMDDELFRALRDDIGLPDEAAAKMAALLADREAARAVSVAKSDAAFDRAGGPDGSLSRYYADLFKNSVAEIKKMFTGRRWNGWVVYGFVVISLTMVLAPTLVGVMIYAWFVL